MYFLSLLYISYGSHLGLLNLVNFGAGNKMKEPHVLIMAMPLNMILVVCHTMYIVI